ncbi:MAG: copper chaperone PCu(A)C [Parvularculaceae bacterium]
MRIALILAVLGSLLAACARESAPAKAADPCADAPDGQVTVKDVWLRPATAGQPTSALYALVCNRTGSADALIAVRTDAASAVELHATQRQPDGAVSMSKLERIDVPAGGAAALEPGGAHVMLIGLAAALEEGSTRDVVFEFENARAVAAVASVMRDDESLHEHSH